MNDIYIYRDYIGVIWGKYWGYIGIMVEKMETTIYCLCSAIFGASFFASGLAHRGLPKP